jgi:hypothetical protein
MIGPTDILHPSPTPHFKNFHVFLSNHRYGDKIPVSALDVYDEVKICRLKEETAYSPG